MDCGLIIRGFLGINALHACVYIYIQELSSFVTTLWFIDLTVATCHIQYLSEFMSKHLTRKRAKHKNTRSLPFSYDTKMAADG